MMTERLATIKATAMIGNEVMKNYLNEDIVETLECSTDIPSNALGEVVAATLTVAWRAGIDPARTKGFHIVVSFE
jgi:hypothetical protein